MNEDFLLKVKKAWNEVHTLAEEPVEIDSEEFAPIFNRLAQSSENGLELVSELLEHLKEHLSYPSFVEAASEAVGESVPYQEVIRKANVKTAYKAGREIYRGLHRPSTPDTGQGQQAKLTAFQVALMLVYRQEAGEMPKLRENPMGGKKAIEKEGEKAGFNPTHFYQSYTPAENPSKRIETKNFGTHILAIVESLHGEARKLAEADLEKHNQAYPN